MKIYLTIILLMVFLTGCSGTKTVITETTEEISVQPEPIKVENLPVIPINIPDTAYNDFVNSFTDSSSLIITGATETGSVDVKIRKKTDNKGRTVLAADIGAKPSQTKAMVKKQQSVTTKEPSLFERISKFFSDFFYYIVLVLFIMIVFIIYIKMTK